MTTNPSELLSQQSLFDRSDDGQLQYVSRYRDNLDFVVDRNRFPALAPIGELESIALADDDRGQPMHSFGTGVLISPCLIITNHHVVFGGAGEPVAGKDYRMLFRVGVSPNPQTAFLGNTLAVPILWGDLGTANQNDWAILRLKTCVGAKPGIGWFERSSISPADLIGREVALAGYAGHTKRGQLSFSTGFVRRLDRNSLLVYSASAAPGQSGGAVMAFENGTLRFVGIHVVEFLGKDADERRKTGNNLFDTFSDALGRDGIAKRSNANEFLPLAPVFSRPDIRNMLDADIAAYSQNPALSYMSSAWPTQ